MQLSSPIPTDKLRGRCRPPVLILILVVLAHSATAQQDGPEADYAVVTSSNLEVIIGDNGVLANHKAGYNGIFAVKTRETSTSPFYSEYAGMNLEHYFSGGARPQDDSTFFEPRHAALEFNEIDEQTVELYQPQTPHFGVESWSRFLIKDPSYIDLQFRCVPHEDLPDSDFLGVFWASYMNGPMDKSIYFLREGSSLEDPKWAQLCTQQHGLNSTVRPAGESADLQFEEPGDLLYANFSPLRYAVPFFYGRLENFVVIYIFKPGDGAEVRFAHSPTGGGATLDGADTNPAWDFQLIIPEYETGKEYTLDARLVYKPWKDRDDVIAEVRKFLNE